MLTALLMLSTSAFAKKSQAKTFTHSYKATPTSVVLSDLQKKTDAVLVFSEDDVDMNKPITASFKDASVKGVLKKVLGKEFVITAKKGVFTITRKPVPPTTYEVLATVPSRVEEDSLSIRRIYEDTTYSVACKNMTIRIEPEAQAAPAPSRKGHYVQAGLGVGYSSLGYTLRREEEKVGANQGDWGGMLDVKYAYYFHENWGVALGVGASRYGSYGVLNHEVQWDGQTDSDGERYNHVSTTNNWREHQSSLMVDFPIGVQCQYPIQDNLRLYGGAGMRIGLPIYNNWRLSSGSLTHIGRYPQWGLTLDEELQDRDFFTEYIGRDVTLENGVTNYGFQRDRHALELNKLSLGVMADMGVMLPLTEQIDLMVGAYFQMTCNNLRPEGGEAMGWQRADYSGDMKYRNHTFMNNYQGEIASTYADKVMPYQVGVKVSVSWHHTPKVKAPQPRYELHQVCDTTFSLKERVETEMKPREAAKEIVILMRKSVIWFGVDSSEPILEPADILDKVAEILVANPELHVLVNGHASREGNAQRNQRLSERRAQAVADLLKAKGVRAEQLTISGLGTAIDYQVEDGGEHTISLDRRVEIIPQD